MTADDIIQYDIPKLIATAFIGGAVGVIGFTILWVAIGLIVPSLFEFPYSLLIFTFGGGFGFAGFAMLRNRILRRIANRGFLFTFRSERLFRETFFWVAITLAMYGLLARTGIIPEYSAALSILSMGLYFVLPIPRLMFAQLMPELRVARLCMLQFLHDWNSGNPADSTGHSWLRKSLRGSEQQLKGFGLSVPAGALFLGASYSIFKGTMSSMELKLIGDWLIKPGDWHYVNWTIPYILSQAKEAERTGFGKPLGTWERFARLPLANLATVTGIIVAVLTIGGAMYELLKYLLIIP